MLRNRPELSRRTAELMEVPRHETVRPASRDRQRRHRATCPVL